MNNIKTNSTSPSTSVLVVDNDQSSTGLLLKIFARKGIFATIASDTKSVSSFLDKNRYDLAFCTINIGRPEKGFKLIGEIKASSPEMPIIIIGESNGKSNEHQLLIDMAVKAMN